MSEKKELTKNPGGRPTNYTPSVCAEVAVYLAELQPKDFPSLEAFSDRIGVDEDTITNWQKVHPEFFGAIKAIRKKQREYLQEKGLTNKVNTTMAIFLLKALHGYKDNPDTMVQVNNSNVQVVSYKDSAKKNDKSTA